MFGCIKQKHFEVTRSHRNELDFTAFGVQKLTHPFSLFIRHHQV